VSILAIDAGTTGVTCLIVDELGTVTARGYREFEQHFPHPGWVEHDPEQIWQAVLAAAAIALASAKDSSVTAIGITNQRETVVVWDRESLVSPRRAIVWQDRRTAEIISGLRDQGLESLVRAKTGLGLDPYFSSSKLLWISVNEPEIWAGVESGQLAVGTVDSYLVARLTGGASHITDASNASRTQLMNIDTGRWDPELLSIFKVPEHALPEIVANFGLLATTDPDSFHGISAAITGMAGDQQAALFGQAGFDAGDNKCTYGTGAFILQNTGAIRVESTHGLITTVAWQTPDGEITYALEGSVFVAGSAVQWLRDGLQVIDYAPDVNALAESVQDSGGLVFVPALTGLGAPQWDPDARGSIFGITRGTTKAHLARASLEAIAFQVRGVVDAITKDVGIKLKSLRVDGGAAASDLLLQTQADALGIPVIRGTNLAATGLGAAMMAGLGAGIWKDFDDLRGVFALDQKFEPAEFDETRYVRFNKAIELTRLFN
jgi:glycerol kinase